MGTVQWERTCTSWLGFPLRRVVKRRCGFPIMSDTNLSAFIWSVADLLRGDYKQSESFLSQIFDYQNTAIEKRAIFYKLILPQLEFGRQREGIDLSKIVLTHHHLRNLGKRAMPLHEGETPKLAPLTETGSGSVQEKEKVLLTEIIRKLNDLFGEGTTEHDQLVYVNQTIKGKLLESSTLRKQAASNSKEQFASSPDLRTELQNAIIASYDAHTAMSTRALNSPAVLEGLMEVLLNYSKLWESLRNQAAG